VRLYYGVLQKVCKTHPWVLPHVSSDDKLYYVICVSYSLTNSISLLPFLLPQQTKRDLEKLVDEINAGRPQCPVGLNTLVIPRKVTLGEHVNQPYVYLNCGHVQGELMTLRSLLLSLSPSLSPIPCFTFLLLCLGSHSCCGFQLSSPLSLSLSLSLWCRAIKLSLSFLNFIIFFLSSHSLHSVLLLLPLPVLYRVHFTMGIEILSQWRRRWLSSLSFIQCWHVLSMATIGHHDWGQDKTGARRCPMCLELSPVVHLCMGIEPAFYVDSGQPTYAFNPCGHMATEQTVK
jgi:hypothetical protein